MNTLKRNEKYLRVFSPASEFFAFLALFLLTLSSCTNHTTAPATSSSSSFITNPGNQVTQNGETVNIAWLSSGNDVAYSALTLHGSMLEGNVKSVNLDTKAVTVLDPTVRIFNQFESAGDSVCYVTLNLDNSTGLYLISGINPQSVVTLTSQRVLGALISPDRNIVVPGQAFSDDSMHVISTKTSSRWAYPLQSNEGPVVFSPDSKKVLLSTGRILNIIDGSSTLLPSQIPPLAVSFNWNSNGLWALTVTQDSTHTYSLTNLLDNSSTIMWHGPSNEIQGSMFAWSPNNDKIAFLCSTPMSITPTVHYLYVGNISTKSAVCVVAVTVHIHDSYLAGIDSFTFSPDGNRIAYVVEGNLYYQNL